MNNAMRNPKVGWIVGAAFTASIIGLATWYRRPLAPAPKRDTFQEEQSLLYRYLPEAEFAGEVAVNIQATPAAIFDALHRVTLNDMPFAKWLGTLRYLPGKLSGKEQPVDAGASEPFLQLIQSEGGNLILGEKAQREIVFGAIGKFHNLSDQQIVPLTSAQQFIDFDHPEYQKLAMSFRVTPLLNHLGYRLALTHCTHALSPQARRNFALYWLAIKPGGNFVSWLMLRAVKSLAEKATEEVAFAK